MLQHSASALVLTSPERLVFCGIEYRCAVGPAGFSASKREGDGATPVGVFPLRSGFYRPDRVTLPATALPMQPLTPALGWCDDPAHPAYNTLVTLPFAASHERLWREDHVYDIVIPLGYNDGGAGPIQLGAGSAIFFHLAHPDFRPTEGCIAIAQADMLQLLPQLTPDTQVIVDAALDRRNAR